MRVCSQRYLLWPEKDSCAVIEGARGHAEGVAVPSTTLRCALTPGLRTQTLLILMQYSILCDVDYTLEGQQNCRENLPVLENQNKRPGRQSSRKRPTEERTRKRGCKDQESKQGRGRGLCLQSGILIDGLHKWDRTGKDLCYACKGAKRHAEGFKTGWMLSAARLVELWSTQARED